MAHTLSISDGSTTISLTETTDAGYHMQSFRPPRPNRVLSRVGAFPFSDGERTVAAGLADSAVEIIVHIVGTSVDDSEAKLRALTVLLEQAQRWNTEQTGGPVRLLWKRQGTTNTAYRVITGVPRLPEPVDDEGGDWLDLSTVTLTLNVAFTVTLEPTWHAGALTVLANGDPFTNKPGFNYSFGTTLQGDMASRCLIAVKRTDTINAWTSVMMALLAGTPDVANFIGTADAAAYDGFSQTTAVNGTATDIGGGSGSWTLATKHAYPLRCLVRVAVPTGTATAVQLRAASTLGFGTTYSPWVNFPIATVDYLLLDLGTIRTGVEAILRNGVNTYGVTIQARTTDASSVSVKADYAEVLPYRAFVRADPSLATNDTITFADTETASAFTWPRQTTFAGWGLAAGGLRALTRYGRLAALPVPSTTYVWAGINSGISSRFDFAGEITLSYLPAYSLGLRGAL